MAEIQNQKNENPAQPTDAKVAALGQSIDVGIHNLRDSNLFKDTKPFVIDTLRQEKMSEAIASQIAPIAITVGAGISPVAPLLSPSIVEAATNAGFDTKVVEQLKHAVDRLGGKLPRTDVELKSLAREVAEMVTKDRSTMSEKDMKAAAKAAAQEVLKAQQPKERDRNIIEATTDSVWYFLKKLAGVDVNAPSSTRPLKGSSSTEATSASTPQSASDVKNTTSKEEAPSSKSTKKEDETTPVFALVVDSPQDGQSSVSSGTMVAEADK
jgi:hypothetical protein